MKSGVQQEISKAYELRVFAFAERVRAFRVNSQDHKLSEVDWRRKALTLPFEEYELPENIKTKVLEMKSSLGLFYGSFDFIVDMDGGYWYLECNPDGQWMWLDKACNGTLTDEFAYEISKLYERIVS